jgi:hypothetical protein
MSWHEVEMIDNKLDVMTWSWNDRFHLHVMSSYLLSIISTSCHDILFVIYHFNFMSWHLICYLSFQLHVMTSYLLSIISTSCHDILFVIYHFNFMSWHLICYLSFQLHVMTSYLFRPSGFIAPNNKNVNIKFSAHNTFME